MMVSQGQALESVAEARRELDDARDRFHEAIAAAADAGATLRPIAAAASLSHQRVHQLLEAHRRAAGVSA